MEKSTRTFIIVLLMFQYQSHHLILVSGQINAFFVHEIATNINEKLSLGCIQQEPMARGQMTKCAVLCARDNTCVGISIDGTSHQCYLHRQCPLQTSKGRVTATSGHRYMVRSDTPVASCLNEGNWNEHNKMCECKSGWTGQRCEQMAKTCGELLNAGYPSGDHFVNLDIHNDVTSSIWVMCSTRSKDQRSYILVAKNTGRNNDYNKTYAEYVNGFGIKADTMWIGLENLYLLNRVGYETFYTDVSITSTTGYFKFFGYYELVSLSKNQEKYNIMKGVFFAYSTGDSSRYLADCFGSFQGSVPFSSWDSDQDGDPKHNCAASAGTGWWFIGCSPTCNLLGKWGGIGTDTSSQMVLKIAGLDLRAIGAKDVEIAWYVDRRQEQDLHNLTN